MPCFHYSLHYPFHPSFALFLQLLPSSSPSSTSVRGGPLPGGLQEQLDGLLVADRAAAHPEVLEYLA